ncbi:hypothetical protein [Lutimonas sp.]|uniref:hypothetical protein n=1 Tax=Lutimonas sp. TaxID=1872403 RepID=UPI003C74DED4
MKVFKISMLMFFLFSFFIQAQESQIEEKSISKHYASENLESALVLSRAEQWFGREENSEQFEIVSLDQKKGEMLVEGSTKVLYKNMGKELYPKRSGMAEVLEASFGNMIRIQTETGGYTITYEVIDMKQEMYKMEDLFFNCVDFKSIDQKNLKEYNKAMNKLLKANLVFKKRREIFTENSKSQFEEVNNYLLNAGEVTIFSIHEAIESE